MFHSIGIYVTNTLFSNVLINLTLLRSMGLLSVHSIFLKYKDTPEFTEDEYRSHHVRGGN
jgi:hypothetical protein